MKRGISERSSSKPLHGSRLTNNGLLMRSVGAGIGVVLVLSWMTGQFVQASPEQKLDERPSALPVSAHTEDGSTGSISAEGTEQSMGESPMPAVEQAHGPALTVPEEMIAMFQQRKQDLERRENAVRTAEGQLALLKAEVEEILTKVEAAEKRRLEQEKTAVGPQASQRTQTVDRRTQLAKIYESMPAEEAAARIERMADRKALDILRLVKSKSAGAILAQVKVDRAVKLSEALLTAP